MFLKIVFVMLVTLWCCNCAYVYSSFWAPLFNPKILNYRVDAAFDPDAGKNNRAEYEKSYGVRGQNLIEHLGNGKGPGVNDYTDTGDGSYGPIKFYYTYPGAERE